MRKILSGLFFRLIKGFEIWAIIALLIWASVAIDKILFATSDISAFRNESMNTVPLSLAAVLLSLAPI